MTRRQLFGTFAAAAAAPANPIGALRPSDRMMWPDRYDQRLIGTWTPDGFKTRLVSTWKGPNTLAQKATAQAYDAAFQRVLARERER